MDLLTAAESDSSPHLPISPTHRSDGDDGFSMIELMVTLLVIGILLVIAVPTFLGTTAVADDRSAESNLATALVDAKTQFQSGGQTYDVNGASDPVALAGLLTSAQLSLTFRAGLLGPLVTQGSSGSLSSISVGVSQDGNGLVMAAYSVPGNCFYVVDNPAQLSVATALSPPYAGASVVTQSAQAAPAGSIGLPSNVGTNYVEVKGDTTKTDCNAYRPRTSGPPATVRYLTSGFPN